MRATHDAGGGGLTAPNTSLASPVEINSPRVLRCLSPLVSVVRGGYAVPIVFVLIMYNSRTAAKETAGDVFAALFFYTWRVMRGTGSQYLCTKSGVASYSIYNLAIAQSSQQWNGAALEIAGGVLRICFSLNPSGLPHPPRLCRNA